jgi:hypothetical protein
MPQIRQTAGVLYAVTAIVSGYWEVSLMLRPLIGGPWSWWYMIMLGASVLLLVGGVHAVAPQVKWAWLVALAVVVSLVLWSLFRDGSWGVLTLASTLQRGSLVAVIASVALAAWWVPASVRTLSAYSSPRPSSPDPAELLWALVPIFLIIASIITGVVLMINRDKGKVIGTAGLMALLASWAVFWVPHSVLARRWDPWLFLLAIILSAPGAVVPGIIAGRIASKWWYVVAGAGFLSAAVLLADLAV